MSIKKVTLASLILLGLTACGSGGSGGSSNNVAKPNTKPQTTQQQADKAAAEKAAKDKAAKEKAEAERLAAEKAAKEKAEAERLAAEKAAKEKAEAERLAAEKEAKEKTEIERLKALAIKAGYSDSEAESFAKHNLNGEPNNYLSYLGSEKYNKVHKAALKAGLSEEQAQQLASEYSAVDADITNADKDISSLVTEKVAKEKAEKAEETRLNNRIDTLKQDAIASGLSEDLVIQLQNMVVNQLLNDDVLNTYENALNNAKVLTEVGKNLTVNTHFHQDKIVTESLNDVVHSKSSAEKFFLDTFKGFNGDLYATGLNRGKLEKNARTTFHTDYVFQRVEGSRDDIYNQKYSAVMAQYYTMNGTYNNIPVYDEGYNVYQVNGLNTNPTNIPNEGKATYQGAAFNGNEQGNLTYNVNFVNRSGDGSISNLSKGNITLKNAQLDDLLKLSGDAEVENGDTGSYSLEFFGPKAEEIGGKMTFGDKDNYGLAGTRGDIQK